jgi:hypothetical protein
MKRGLLLIVLTIVSISFISAYGSYGFSIGNFFDNIDPSTLVLGALFIIFFGVLHFIFSRFFKRHDKTPNTALSAAVSFAASILMIYGIHRTDLDIEDFFFDIGISEGILEVVVPILLLIGFIFLWSKVKEKVFLIFAGLFLFVAIFTNWVYDKGVLLWIGGGLIIVWAIIAYIRRKKKHSRPRYYYPHP